MLWHIYGGIMSGYNYAKKIDIIGEYDVAVVGGGPAGICAAASAARMGARVLLIERHGVLGGNLTIGHVSPILGAVSEGTMYSEIEHLLDAEHKDAKQVMTRNGREIHIDHEEAKGILASFVKESGAELMLCTSVVDVIKDGDKVTGLVINTPEGLCAVSAKVVIDASGDGHAAYLAGAEYKIGRDGDGKTQPCTLEFLVDGVDESVAISAWGGSDPVKLPSGQEYRELCKQKNAEGELPKNVTIVRLHRTFYDGERSVNATQLNDIDPLDGRVLGNAEVELRSQIESVLHFLQKYVPGYENCRIKSSASVLGVRETRRITGEYVLCDKDVEDGARFDDVVVHKAWFLIDIHNPAGGGQAEGHSKMAQPYDIPYRCLLPLGVENLLTSGRCISGTHRAHASYRVMAICMATGEAAGVAAALAARIGRTVREVGASEVQEVLAGRGVRLFD